MKSFLGDTTAPRGIRNNNPGNLIKTSIKWKGKITPGSDKKFEQFDSISNGIRAMAIDTINDITKKGLNTLEKLITEYAPPSENNTAAYIKQVSKATGLKPGQPIPLQTEVIGAIIAAKIRMENGPEAGRYITGADIAEALQTIPDKMKSILKTAGKIAIWAIPLAILLFLLYAGKKRL